jgi:hypothetical protein
VKCKFLSCGLVQSVRTYHTKEGAVVGVAMEPRLSLRPQRPKNASNCAATLRPGMPSPSVVGNSVGQRARPTVDPNRRPGLRLPNGAIPSTLLTSRDPTTTGRAAGRALTRPAAPRPAYVRPSPEFLDVAVAGRSLSPARPQRAEKKGIISADLEEPGLMTGLPYGTGPNGIIPNQEKRNKTDPLQR